METVSFMSSGASAGTVIADGSAADEFWARERAWQIEMLTKPFTVQVRAAGAQRGVREWGAGLCAERGAVLFAGGGAAVCVVACAAHSSPPP